MSFTLTDKPKVHRRHQIALVGLLVVALCVGFLASWPPSAVPIAQAACGIHPGWCPFGDLTRTSVLTVNHAYNAGEYIVPVEPDDTDTWTVTGTWSSPFDGVWTACSCVDDQTTSVTVDVTWSDATHAWSASCTGCSVNGPIYSVGVCLDGSYCSGDVVVDNSAGYKLYVDMAQQYNWLCSGYGGRLTPVILTDVTYATTSVDDGNLLNMIACTEGASVSPTTQTWTQIDYGPYECAYDCDQSGPSVTIWYE